jgi:hypothetical protein
VRAGFDGSQSSNSKFREIFGENGCCHLHTQHGIRETEEMQCGKMEITYYSRIFYQKTSKDVFDEGLGNIRIRD